MRGSRGTYPAPPQAQNADKACHAPHHLPSPRSTFRRHRRAPPAADDRRAPGDAQLPHRRSPVARRSRAPRLHRPCARVALRTTPAPTCSAGSTASSSYRVSCRCRSRPEDRPMNAHSMRPVRGGTFHEGERAEGATHGVDVSHRSGRPGFIAIANTG